MELNIGFNVLEIMVAMQEYHEACPRCFHRGTERTPYVSLSEPNEPI